MITNCNLPCHRPKNFCFDVKNNAISGVLFHLNVLHFFVAERRVLIIIIIDINRIGSYYTFKGKIKTPNKIKTVYIKTR